MSLPPDLLATILVLTSATLHATWSAIIKQADDKLAVSMVMSVAGAAVSLPFTAMVPLPDAHIGGLLAASTLVHMLYQRTLVWTLGRGDLTLVYPIARGSGPLFVTLFSLAALGASIGVQDLSAIAIIVCGILWTGLGQHRNPVAALATPGVGPALLCGMLIATYTIIDGHGVRITAHPFTYILWMNVVFGPAFLLAGLAERRGRLLADMKACWRMGFLVMVIAYTGYALALLAFRHGGLAEVTALRETSIIFAACIGWIWLKEPFSRTKAVAVTMVAAGAVLLKAL